jgi:hypothetical protein
VAREQGGKQALAHADAFTGATEDLMAVSIMQFFAPLMRARRRAVLVAVVLAAVLLVSSCGDKPQPVKSPEPPKGGFECLTTPNGIPRKVIIKSQEAVAYESYDFTGTPKPLKFFRKYFVFKEQAGKGYLVGEATVRDSTVGWVKAEDVMPWNHEQALFFINKQGNGRTPVKLWMDRREIGRSDAPYFEENLSARQTTEPFAILQKEGSAVRVAFLWGKQGAMESVPVDQLDVSNAQTVRGEAVERGSRGAALTSGGGNALPRVQAGLRRMDIVLVMDVSSSMGPYMEAVKQKMTQMVNQLANLGSAEFPVEAHIGVVAYRDYADAKTSFTTKLLDLTADRKNVDRFLADLQPSSVGKDKYEAVFEGLSDAIERLHWDPYSHKVMVLVGDAPPQGFTATAAPEAGVQSNSPYFSRAFSENVKTIQRKVEDNGIRFYALGVGNDPEMEGSFRQIVGSSQSGGFQALAGAGAFIAQLEAELRKQRGEQAATGKIADSAIEKIKSGAAVSEAEQLVLNERNLTPEKIAELSQSRIQTGWFDVDAVSDRVSVCVYLRRKDLEATLMDLRSRARDGVSAQELEVLKAILEPHVGKESLQNVKNINDLVKVVSDLPLPPEVVRQIVGKYDDSDVTRVLRTKMNNIMILLLQKQLFNNYEEGWIPMEYLPGSLSKEQ